MALRLEQQTVVYNNAVAFPPRTTTPATFSETILTNNDNFRTSKYNARAAVIVGAIQMTIGILCIICGSVLFGISQSSTLTFTSIGISSGVVAFVAGLLGVLSGRNVPSLRLIISTMVMTFICAVLTPVLLISCVNSALQTGRYHDYRRESFTEIRIAMNFVLATFLGVEGIAAIAASVLCCKALYYHFAKPHHSNSVYVPGTQQAVYVPNDPGYTAMVPSISEEPINPTLYPPFQQYPIIPTAPIFDGYNDVPASPPPPYKE